MDCESDAKPFRFGENLMKNSHLHVVTDSDEQVTISKNIMTIVKDNWDILAASAVIMMTAGVVSKLVL
jgi:hypothetical protein